MLIVRACVIEKNTENPESTEKRAQQDQYSCLLNTPGDTHLKC